MNANQVVEFLRKETKENPVANDVFHVLAARERARSSLTVHGLMQRMEKEGFKHTPAEYAQVLKVIAKAGLGRLETEANGKVVGLKDIRLTLQSIGAAAIGEKANFQSFRMKKRNKFAQLVNNATKKHAVQELKTVTKEVEKESKVMTIPISLNVDVNGKLVKIPLSEDLTGNDIAVLIRRLGGAK